MVREIEALTGGEAVRKYQFEMLVLLFYLYGRVQAGIGGRESSADRITLSDFVTECGLRLYS